MKEFQICVGQTGTPVGAPVVRFPGTLQASAGRIGPRKGPWLECLHRESGRGWVQPPSPASQRAAARKPRQHLRLLADSRENVLIEVKITCCSSWGLSGRGEVSTLKVT